MTKRAMDQSNGAAADYLPSQEPQQQQQQDQSNADGLNGLNNNNNNSEAKRAKLDNAAKGGVNPPPSRVIHIRNIPPDVTEAEIIHLGIPFGRVTNVLVLKGKNQAFLEMEEETSAVAMVNYFTNCVAQLRDRSVYVQFSNHKELKTDQSHSNANASAQAALQAAQALSGQDSNTNGCTGGDAVSTKAGNASAAGSNATSTNAATGGPNTVLRVIVEQMVYPVTLDVMYQIFTRMGKVLKIVTFTKNNTFQALIQYPDVIMAQAAKLSLDGQNIYNACCKLRIEYSKLSNLNVKYNNDKSRDYTNPALPTGDPALDSAMQLSAANSAAVLGSPFSAAAMGIAAAAAAAAGNNHAAALNYGTPVSSSSSSNMAGLAGFPLAAAAAAAANPNSFGQPRSSTGGGNGVAGIGGSNSCVLLVSNLDENLTHCDHLFILFGVYGDVQRVKILFNKKDTALVQMSEPHQALLAMNHLDKIKLWSKTIRVMSSKHTSVQLPKEGQPDAGLTKDYSTSNLHRFKKPGSKNYSNIYPPSSTLHLSNIPSSVKEDDLRAAFMEIGLSVQAFKFFPKDHKMALVQLSDVDEAIMALIKLHNYQLSETSHLRVSFSKSTI